MSNRILRPFDRNRQRGWVPWMWAGAVAVAGSGAGIVWSISDWRVERTSDGRMCGIERNVRQFSGTQQATAATESQACAALFAQPPAQCPTFSPSSIARCGRLAQASAVAERIVWSRFDRERVTDTGLWALAVSRATALGRRARDVLTTGGSPCPVTPEVAYEIEWSQGWCLGVAISATRIATAAHCVPSPPATFSAFCQDNARTLVNVQCRMADEAKKNEPYADLAVCTLLDAPSNCLSKIVEKPNWAEPLPRPTQLHVMGIGGDGCLKLDASDGTKPIYWPSAPEDPLRVIMPQDITFDGGDSGGPVFDRPERGTRRLIGVNTRTSLPGGPATIVPLYRWPQLESP